MWSSPPKDATKKIRRYLDLIGRGEAPESAWEQATSESLAAEYEAPVRELLEGPVSTTQKLEEK